MFTVPKKDGTRRPVIDLRQLNQFVERVPFKMEDLTQIPSVLQKGDFRCKIDLQDALPFGLASSPRIFYQMPEATAGLSSVSWGASAGLPGRFSDNGSYKEAMSGTGPANRRFMREARLSDKSR